MALHVPDPLDVVAALRRGPATLEALASRLGTPHRDGLSWAIDEAVARGWAVRSDADDCGPAGVCSTSPPAILTLTPAGSAAARG